MDFKNSKILNSGSGAFKSKISMESEADSG